MDSHAQCIKEAEAMLRLHPVQNAYPLLRISQGMVAECEVMDGAVRLLDAQNGKYMYAADSFCALRALYERVSARSGPHISLVTDARFLREIPSLGQSIRVNAFHQLLATTHLQPEDLPGVTFTGITEASADWILSVYEHPELSRAFILERMKGPNMLALHHDTPVGFIMSHCDAELGPAYVSPDFRGSGLATQLFAHIMRQFLAQGIRPVMFVTQENTRSLRWLERIGCNRTDENALWFWRDENNA
ncbi:MAG: GNAT family N-acetyltransferase [Bacillota bacterium]